METFEYVSQPICASPHGLSCLACPPLYFDLTKGSTHSNKGGLLTVKGLVQLSLPAAFETF